MTPPEVKAPKIILARDQAEYGVLTVAQVTHPSYGPESRLYPNSLLMAFRPSAYERQLIAARDDIYVSLLTGGAPMQPILVMCGKHQAAAVFGVEAE